MKIAIVGAGISGLVAARELAREHEITVFEAANHIGGHTHTVDIELRGRHYAVDTGFIVFNDRTYPNFVHLLDELGVASQTTDMSFSVHCERSRLEYNGTSLNGLFAQRRNLVRPSFLGMLRDILRFNREAPRLLATADGITLGEYLSRERYSNVFINHYIVPMGAAIWSAQPSSMFDFPARFFIRFFANHGLLSINDRPQWRTVRGGSREYVVPLVAPFRDRIRLRTPVAEIRRVPGGVVLNTDDGERHRFDHVLLACHSDTALRLLADADPFERSVLSAIAYQPNDVVLHTDGQLMPRRRRAWAAWNYRLPDGPGEGVSVTYNMNVLQRMESPLPLLVSLNCTDRIDPERILRRFRYDHPVYTPESIDAQARHAQLNGRRRTWFCGAWWGAGFHEDGVVSALRTLDHFRRQAHAEQLPLRRAG